MCKMLDYLCKSWLLVDMLVDTMLTGLDDPNERVDQIINGKSQREE